ncbi:MAG: hypothetical protein ACREXY_27410, partial [Gammaproteobacteria bacterium]
MPTASQSLFLEQQLQPILESLGKEGGRPCLVGLPGSSGAFALTLLARASSQNGDGATGRSWLIVSASDEAAERLYDDLRFYHELLGLSSEPLAFFPQWETLPYESTPPPVDLIARRMLTLQRLTRLVRTVLVTSVPALMQRVLPRDVLASACLSLKPNATIEREALTSG